MSYSSSVSWTSVGIAAASFALAAGCSYLSTSPRDQTKLKTIPIPADCGTTVTGEVSQSGLYFLVDCDSQLRRVVFLGNLKLLELLPLAENTYADAVCAQLGSVDEVVCAINDQIDPTKQQLSIINPENGAVVRRLGSFPIVQGLFSSADGTALFVVYFESGSSKFEKVLLDTGQRVALQFPDAVAPATIRLIPGNNSPIFMGYRGSELVIFDGLSDIRLSLDWEPVHCAQSMICVGTTAEEFVIAQFDVSARQFSELQRISPSELGVAEGRLPNQTWYGAGNDMLPAMVTIVEERMYKFSVREESVFLETFGLGAYPLDDPLVLPVGPSIVFRSAFGFAITSGVPLELVSVPLMRLRDGKSE